MIATGNAAAYMKGCLLPHLDLVLSEKYPTRGSVMASAIRTRFKAKPAIHAGNPKTELYTKRTK